MSEERCFRFFVQAFPSDFLFPNPKFQYKRGEHEIADLIILFDDILLIVQNKSKLLTIEAQKGDVEAIKQDLQNSIIEAYKQCVNAKGNLLAGKLSKLTNNKWNDVPIKISNIHKIYFIITLEDRFPILFLKDLESFIDFKKEGYPFLVNLYDLDIITHELSTPLEFIEYLEKRIELNSKGIVTILDELDLLGYYLLNEYDFQIAAPKDKKAPNTISIFLSWEEFNRERAPLLRKKIERDKYCVFFDDIIGRAHESNDLIAFEVITNLSKLSRTERRVVGRKALEKSMQAALDRKFHHISIKPDSTSFGITLLFTPKKHEERINELIEISMAAQYLCKCKLWLGVASEPSNSKGRSYSYLLLEKEWEYNPQLEYMVNKMFKSPERTSEKTYED